MMDKGLKFIFFNLVLMPNNTYTMIYTLSVHRW
jgi:hypothetical protein